jgi:hypothetical protein
MDVIINFFKNILPHFILTHILNNDNEHSKEGWNQKLKRIHEKIIRKNVDFFHSQRVGFDVE